MTATSARHDAADAPQGDEIGATHHAPARHQLLLEERQHGKPAAEAAARLEEDHEELRQRQARGSGDVCHVRRERLRRRRDHRNDNADGTLVRSRREEEWLP
jgi:hypothetical protein